MKIKRAAFAGSWYPESAKDCEREIKSFLKEKNGALDGDYCCGIVPHAGWFFSGSIACRVIASLGSKSLDTSSVKTPDVVIIFGMHMHPETAPCIMGNGAWETPFGRLLVHEETASSMVNGTGIRMVSPRSFPEENTIELQLPFIKYFFPKSAIVPMGVPPSPIARKIGIKAVEAARLQGIDIVIIGSTDLTHYGDNFGFTPAGRGKKALEWVRDVNDKNAVDAILHMDCSTIIKQGTQKHNMCCAGAAAATVAAANQMGAVQAVEVDYATSFDKSPGESFVGYAGILFGR